MAEIEYLWLAQLKPIPNPYDTKNNSDTAPLSVTWRKMKLYRILRAHSFRKGQYKSFPRECSFSQ